MKRQGNKGSKRGAMHPYLRTEKWMNELAFWRRPFNPGGTIGYKVQAYEDRLAEWIKGEKNSAVLTENIQTNRA